MLCQICEKNKATVRMKQVVNGKKSEFFLCQACAQHKGMPDPLADLPEVFGKIVANILGEELAKIGGGKKKSKRAQQKRCERCGISLADFERRGLLGCADCYHAFENEIKLLLRRIHGSNHHTGRRPQAYRRKPAKNVVTLRKELERAIGQQQFERAAELRDLIRAAEKTAGSSGRRKS